MTAPAGQATTALPTVLRNGVVALGLADVGQPVRGVALTGGVASDIWRADLPGGPICVKRALGRLRVDSEWIVPTNRTAFEAAWLRAADAARPGAACRVIGFDPDSGVLALAWLDPTDHSNWRSELSAGHVDAAVAAALGDRLGHLHAAMADPDRFAAAFAAGELFRALRLDPYFAVTASAHPVLAATLDALVDRTASTGSTVIHGDVSPKNVLVGPDGPVLVDAECASWGDPAFDVAFCISHLLLKAIWHPGDTRRLLEASHRFATSYLAHVAWEQPDALAGRAAMLVPALALARVDGASPVDYLDAPERDHVRQRATELLLGPPDGLNELLDRWPDDTWSKP
ncbi:MAG: phosphotransferase [Actinobacteria bacterium]|nr:phosphotransferase [Actinomycetota bacterium]